MNSAEPYSFESIRYWRVAQFLVWLIGAALLACLIFVPETGVLLFWNVLIPVAPALFVFALGVWRNVCPLATTNLLPRHLGFSKRKKLTQDQAGIFSLIAVAALYLIVPLRHAIFNHSGRATAIMVIIMATIGVALGFVFEWKSAWCSGLCPIHPVEKLYGENVLVTVPNAHCVSCQNCVIPCPDSTPNMRPTISNKTSFHTISGLLITGGLPGFIWGWFHVPDSDRLSVIDIYMSPLSGMMFSLGIYLLLSYFLGRKNDRLLTSLFAAFSVSCYYWYRIPALLGFGNFADDGLLIDMHDTLNPALVTALQVMMTALLFYWLVIRKPNKKNWALRPQFANTKKTDI